MHAKSQVKFDSSIKKLETQFIKLIQERLGIIIHTHQSYELLKTIQEGCDQFHVTPEEYLTQLTECANQSPLLDHLIKGITVGETYFFRDQQQMQLLQQYVLPELIKNKRKENNLSLRIWSAGCASGEEIFSVAMMLNELLPDIKEWTLKLLATDINTHVLQKAVAGIYTDWSMRSISDYFKNKYFCKEKRKYTLAKSICNLVHFDYLNLNDNNYPSIFNGTNAQDLILCRNVLIYISQDSCALLMKRMSECLVQNGFLMLGASDPINLTGTDLVYHNRKGSLILKTKQEANLFSEKPLPILKSAKIEKLKSTPSIIPSIKRPEKTLLTKPIDMTSYELINKATELANLGKLEEAISLCEKGFKLDPTNKLAYFTYGLAMYELDKISDAEKALRKTLFLDHQFVPGHFQLGILLLKQNQKSAGLKSLKNALNIAETKNPAEMVPGASGMSYARFVEILRHELSFYMTMGG